MLNKAGAAQIIQPHRNKHIHVHITSLLAGLFHCHQDGGNSGHKSPGDALGLQTVPLSSTGRRNSLRWLENACNGTSFNSHRFVVRVKEVQWHNFGGLRINYDPSKENFILFHILWWV